MSYLNNVTPPRQHIPSIPSAGPKDAPEVHRTSTGVTFRLRGIVRETAELHYDIASGAKALPQDALPSRPREGHLQVAGAKANLPYATSAGQIVVPLRGARGPRAIEVSLDEAAREIQRAAKLERKAQETSLAL